MDEFQATADDVIEPVPRPYAPGHGPLAKGYDPRRRFGSPSLGRRITSYWNYLSEENEDGTTRFSEADLKAIVKDPKAPHPKVIASQELLRSRLEGFDRSGRVPKAADTINRILDRDIGKPKITVEIEPPLRTRDSFESELIEFFSDHPILLDESQMILSLMAVARKSPLFTKGIRPVLAQHRPALLETLDQAVSVPFESNEEQEQEQELGE